MLGDTPNNEDDSEGIDLTSLTAFETLKLSALQIVHDYIHRATRKILARAFERVRHAQA